MLLRRTGLLALGSAVAATTVAVPVGGAAAMTNGGVCAGLGGCRVVAHADVNGDGRVDSVGLARRGGGPGNRGALIVRVATAPGRVVSVRRPLENWGGTAWQGVATLDGRRGMDIMVGRQMGASAQFYQSVTWRHGDLVFLDAPGPDRLWGIGQSATVIGGWLRGSKDPAGRISSRVATSASDHFPALYRGRVTTYRWSPQGWEKVRTKTVFPLSVNRARRWLGFQVPGLARV